MKYFIRKTTYNEVPGEVPLDVINIAIIGPVSVGKSTYLNVLCKRDLAPCRIRRETMLIDKITTTDNLALIDSDIEIKKKISEDNNNIIRSTERGEQLNFNDIQNAISTFYIEELGIDIENGIRICLWDFPGLNDAKTKDIYYKFLEEHFHKFNMIMNMTDINSGLNTSDEIDIVNFLTTNILKHKNESNKNIHLLTVVNKADDMQLNGQGKLEIIDTEFVEMFDQIKNTVTNIFVSKNISNNLIDFIPLCGKDAYLFNMIKKDSQYILSKKEINTIGTSQKGKGFLKLSPEQQESQVRTFIQDIGFVNDMLTLSGISEIEKCTNEFIKNNGIRMVIENLLYEYNRIEIITLDNLIPVLNKRIVILEIIEIYDKDAYNIEMKNIVKSINTLLYKHIGVLKKVSDIIEYYKYHIIKNINSDNIISNKIIKFWNYIKYPKYVAEKIIKLITIDYSHPSINVEKLYYFNDLEYIEYLEIEYVNELLDTLMSNPSGYSLFVFSDDFVNNTELMNTFIKLFEKLKNSNNFLNFLRFFLINIYCYCFTRSDEIFIIKKMTMIKYGEIPICEFLKEHMEGNNYMKKKYHTGIKTLNNNNLIFELYYIKCCKELHDDINFISRY
jgi:GTPase SAR1 family protein